MKVIGEPVHGLLLFVPMSHIFGVALYVWFVLASLEKFPVTSLFLLVIPPLSIVMFVVWSGEFGSP